MANLAFTSSVAIHAATPMQGRSLTVRRPSDKIVTSPRMSAADRFQFRSQTREAKQAATSTGVYTVQCTEGTGGENIAEATRMAVLAANYRLRQAPLLQRYADLFATRRAAIVQTHGSHVMESYVVRFPARAAASVSGRAEALKACSRYAQAGSAAEEYMYECVDRQYKMMKVPNGEFSTMCCDGRVKGDAETARVSSLAAQFRGKQFSDIAKAQMRYDSIKEATMLARSCDYEEAYFEQYPKMAASMRYSDGSYAASVNETALLTGDRTMSVEEQVNGPNLDIYWPQNLIRAAVPREGKSWYEASNTSLKKWAYMSPAAMEWGIAAQKQDETVTYGNPWSPGWQPTSKSLVPFQR